MIQRTFFFEDYMFKKPVIWSVFTYGLLIIFLGYFGYYQSQSTASLYSSLVLGGALLTSSFFMWKGKLIGGYLALFLSLLLTAVFAYRFSVSGKMMPAFLSVISAGMLILLLARLLKWKK